MATRLAARASLAWVGFVSERPRAALWLIGALLLGAVLAATRLSVDTDSSRMLSPDLDFQARAQAINTAFPEIKNTIVVVLRGERADPVDAALEALVAALEEDPSVESLLAPAADPFFRRNGLLYLDEAELEAQLTQISKSANLLARLREDQSLGGFVEAIGEAGRLAERADLDASALERLYAEAAEVIDATLDGAPRGFAWADVFEGSEGETMRLLTLKPALDFTAINPAKAAMRAADRAIAGLDPALAAEVDVGMTGDPVLRAEELRSVTATLGASLALSLGLVGLVLWLALGTPARMGLALGALLASLVLTTGLAALAIGALNLVSVAFIVLMVGLGIDFAIHLMAHIEEDAASRPVHEALLRSAEALGPALWLTALTTSAAFLAFATTDFVGMAQLGLIGAMGVIVAFAVAMTLIPAAISLRPGLAAAGRRRLPDRAATPAQERGWLARASLWGALAVGLGAAVIAAQARFDADPMSLRPAEAPSVALYRMLAEDPDRGLLRMSLIAETAEEAAAAAERLGQVEAVGRAIWLGDLVPENQDDKLALVDLAWPSMDFAVNGDAVELGDPAPRAPLALAETLSADGPASALSAALRRAAEAADAEPGVISRLETQLFAYFPALIDRLAAQLEVDRVETDDLPGPLARRYLSEEGLYRVEISPAGQIDAPEARRAFVEAVRAAEPGVGGPPDQIEGAAQSIAGAMIEACLIALAATALLAFAAVGRLATVAAILLPVALAGAVTAAAGVILGLPFNYANVIVLPLLVGLGVDAGVHLALRAERAGAVFSTSTPKAVVASALTTIGAFATLAISEHRGTASMGALLAIAVASAVLMAFALTPTLARLSLRRPATSPLTGDTTP